MQGDIKAGPYVPEVVLDAPNAVRELSNEFLRAGAEVIVALTYYANRNKLKDVGREGDLETLNRQAVRIANQVAKKGNALVAGNICNTWMYDPNDKEKSGKVVRKIYREQLQWAMQEGIDFVISETNDYLEEALIGLQEIKRLGLPSMVTLATIQKDKTADGYDYIEACKILEKNGADIVGLNCDRGPATMLPLLKKIRKAVKCFVAAQPAPYRTTQQQFTFESLKKNGQRIFPLGLDPFLLTRFEMAEFAKKAKAIGINYIGSCCGTNPSMTRAMAEALGRTVPASKYSPVLDLHPVIGNTIQTDNKEFIADWRDD